MPKNELRELLGDRYDEVIERACRAYIVSYEGGDDLWPQWAAFVASAKPDEEGDYYVREIVADTRRDVAALLAAVLPDLLAAAWDEGHDAGFYARERWCPLGESHDASESHATNPYRDEPTEDPR